MHAVLLTLIALGGGVDAAYPAGRVVQSSADIYAANVTTDCQACGHHGHGHHHAHGDRLGGWLGHMPQTCYEPRYGCYYGGGRHMHRYPAFHGTFYRRPYNYRNLFEYPWHAEMHEPTSLFSYNVIGEEVGAIVRPESIGVPPADAAPLPPFYEDARRPAARPQTRDITDPRVSPASTLRR